VPTMVDYAVASSDAPSDRVQWTLTAGDRAADLRIPRKDHGMESWMVQLLTILGVAVGAMASFVSTRLVDRARWQREEALRWDAKRLDGYGEFAASVKRHITISLRLCAGRGMPGMTAQPLEVATGLALLADAEQDLSIKWERVLMLGTPDAIAAAQEWRHVAWHLEAMARGVRDDPAEYQQTMADSGVVRKRFYTAVRADLGIVSGTIPDRAWPPTWAQTPQQSSDSGTRIAD
jgi:hypothetical protein